MILGELVVIEIATRRIVLAADIDDGHRRIIEITLLRLAARNGNLVGGNQKATRKELILMRASRVGQYS